ncbi:unnamed protein product [Paramecium sonneborni]|uniref:Uncharacterized protein n=1 Tax=Paramecium sonneborni TaxID=65129 RepID=A0A8S1KQS5_9CILI|nr:unnamed protein product [Paramecium sonneborni]
MDKLSQKLDKFYTDCYDLENQTRNKSSQNHLDLNTSLDEHFKNLEFMQYNDQSFECED